MSLTPEEKNARKEAFRRMTPAGKAEYLLTYYKFPLVMLTIILIITISGITRLVTRKNELLYLAYVNVAVGEDLAEQLTETFVSTIGENPKKSVVYTYSGIYISDDPAEENHEYSYASKLKVLAAINAKQMDIVLLNQESYDIFSQSGYLLDLSELLENQAPELLQKAAPHLSQNIVVLDDNAVEIELGTADTYKAETRTDTNALEISTLPSMKNAGFKEPVYLGIIANSPRLDQAAAYISYLMQ